MKSKLLLCCAAGALLAAACGSSSRSSSTTSSGGAVTTTGGDSTTAGSSATSVAAGQASAAIPTETGPADKSKSPITIGLIETATGAGAPVPASAPSAKAAVDYINDRLGGIDGHPVGLKTCDTTNDEQQTRICAQQFANDSSVQLVVLGHGDEYSGDIYPVIQSSGLFASVNDSYTTADSTTTDGVTYLPGATGVVKALALYGANTLHAKKYAVVGLNVPVGQQSLAFFKQLAAAQGATATGVLVQPSETDITGPLTASGAASEDALVALVGDSQCVQLANASSELGIKKPVLATFSCWDSTVKTGAGTKVGGWRISFEVAPADIPAGQNPEVDFFIKEMKAYGAGSQVDAYAANATFSQFVAIWSAAKAAGTSADPTARSSWKGILTGYKGPVLMGPRSVSCPGPATAPAVCSFDTTVYTLTTGANPYPANPVVEDTK